jgi:glucosamine-6-phosphate deaminase
MITLDHITKLTLLLIFRGHNVPKRAITMGVSTILKSKQNVLMAWGQNKADIVKERFKEM